MRYLRKFLSACMLSLAAFAATATPSHAQLSKVKTVWVVMMENHNWIGNNAGAKYGDPDIKGNKLAPYINDTLTKISAYADAYYNPPGNHPSQPNYLWIEAGTNFGVLKDTQPGQPQLGTSKHLTALLDAAGITWHAYAEPDFGSAVFDTCPLDFSYLDVEHLGPVFFKDINDGLNAKSKVCIQHVRPFYELATNLADNTVPRFNLITPNLCHDGHEGISPCSKQELGDNTARSDAWLKKNIPVITNSEAYKRGGAIFIVWDEGEDSGAYSDGPIGMFILSPFAKGGGTSAYSNKIHYDHSSLLKTLEEIYNVKPLLGAAADPKTKDLSDLFQ
jgi:phospholipase C